MSEITKGALMNLRSKRTVAAAVAVAALAGGAGVAIAATQGNGDPAEERSAFLDGVASELGVEPEALEDAFQATALERLDAAVADGRISEERAAEIRERIEQGLPPMGRGHGGPGDGGPGHGPGGELFGTAAEYLGLEPDEVFERLRAGDSLADIATAEGKSVQGLEEALLADAEERIHELVNRSFEDWRQDGPGFGGGGGG
jgi:hypothetical protein